MNNQNKHYQQLTQEPRYQISGLRKAGMSLRAIAQEVGVHFSTVSRELNRNETEGCYSPAIAHQMSETRRQTASKANKRTAKSDDIIKDFLGHFSSTYCPLPPKHCIGSQDGLYCPTDCRSLV
jgi:IS30 family transposase